MDSATLFRHLDTAFESRKYTPLITWINGQDFQPHQILSIRIITPVYGVMRDKKSVADKLSKRLEKTYRGIV